MLLEEDVVMPEERIGVPSQTPRAAADRPPPTHQASDEAPERSSVDEAETLPFMPTPPPVPWPRVFPGL